MLSERWLRRSPQEARAALARRGAGAETLAALDAWLTLDAERRAVAARFDALAREGNATRQARRELHELTARQRAVALTLPNAPDPRAPDGSGPDANPIVRSWGTPPTFAFTPAPHDALGARLGLLDLPRATRMSGPRFPLLLGVGARLARALATYLLETHIAAGYLEVAPPDLLRAETLAGTGHLPAHEDELFAVPRDGLYLSPTAEAQLVALHAGETLEGARMPVKLTAYTQAYRREAGSAGAKTRGLLRQRQFGKVELVRIVAPDEADAALEDMIAEAEAPLRALELPYRLVEVCAGELPFSAQRSFDLEVWMPSLAGYLEVASVSNCGTFQARRIALRYRPRPGGAARHPHTLNGSALPIGRTLAALLENGQRADGSVALPAALALYGAPRELRA
ncbi:MAG TPA: serine--tRNA ligase [Ktedonobacterales bacterium]|nr:serine--tRNA ligase [Ktedonobacterales bacterium]